MISAFKLRFEKGRSARRAFSLREAASVAETGDLRTRERDGDRRFFGVEASTRREAEGAGPRGASFFEIFSAF